MTNKKTKCIVRTTRAITLLDLYTNSCIYHNRPTVVVKTPFVEQQRDERNLKILAIDLPMEASDTDFEQVLKVGSKNDETLAVNSFCALFGKLPNGDNVQTEFEV